MSMVDDWKIYIDTGKSTFICVCNLIIFFTEVIKIFWT